jgi:hypothetical protein
MGWAGRCDINEWSENICLLIKTNASFFNPAGFSRIGSGFCRIVKYWIMKSLLFTGNKCVATVNFCMDTGAFYTTKQFTSTFWLTGTVSRDYSVFFSCEKIPTGPLIPTLNPFQIWLLICRYIKILSLSLFAALYKESMFSSQLCYTLFYSLYGIGLGAELSTLKQFVD